jgi:hypothetical protein
MWMLAIPGRLHRNLDENLDLTPMLSGFIALTSTFSVELPGIEPGSYGIPSRLLRAQFALASTRISRSHEPAEMTIPAAVYVPMYPATEHIG